MSLHVGDVREGLRAFAAEGVRAQTCITSPPYWGLRDYGVDGQIGLEPTPDAFVAAMVDVFRLVRDVLADDGTLWLNLGDSYAAQRGGTHQPAETLGGGSGGLMQDGARVNRDRFEGYNPTRNASAIGLKHKDLCGIPWRVAFALQADGWYLRQDIIWHKPNPMPESVRDRCTKAHEYLFLLAKSERYYYDAAAIAEAAVRAGEIPGGGRADTNAAEPRAAFYRPENAVKAVAETRNRRTVWSITSEPYADAHFAVMPTALVEPCIMAGSRPGDIVLDPFMGSGTVAQVAQQLGRRWIGCELNRDYAAMIGRRTAQAGLELA